MANVNGTGTSFNLPNYSGELFTADAENTPFLSMIGGLTGGGMQTDNKEFPTDSLYQYPEASQPEISENDSTTAPQATSYVRGQNKNVTQIFHESVSITYRKMSNAGRLSGINTAGAQNNAPSERDFQIARVLTKIARDVNWTFLNGEYNLAETANEADKTRGMFELTTADNGNAIDANGAELSKALIQQLLKEMAMNGATFSNAVLFCNAHQKQMLSEIYGYAPEDRNVGGVNIQQIETDFARVGIVWDRFVPSNKILIAEMSVIAPVFQPVPDKGVLFYEELSKTGAAEEGQIYGEIGLAHGPAFMHGAITNLDTGN